MHSHPLPDPHGPIGLIAHLVVGNCFDRDRDVGHRMLYLIDGEVPLYLRGFAGCEQVGVGLDLGVEPLLHDDAEVAEVLRTLAIVLIGKVVLLSGSVYLGFPLGRVAAEEGNVILEDAGKPVLELYDLRGDLRIGQYRRVEIEVVGTFCEVDGRDLKQHAVGWIVRQLVRTARQRSRRTALGAGIARLMEVRSLFDAADGGPGERHE